MWHNWSYELLHTCVQMIFRSSIFHTHWIILKSFWGTWSSGLWSSAPVHLSSKQKRDQPKKTDLSNSKDPWKNSTKAIFWHISLYCEKITNISKPAHTHKHKFDVKSAIPPSGDQYNIGMQIIQNQRCNIFIKINNKFKLYLEHLPLYF